MVVVYLGTRSIYSISIQYDTLVLYRNKNKNRKLYEQFVAPHAE